MWLDGMEELMAVLNQCHLMCYETLVLLQLGGEKVLHRRLRRPLPSTRRTRTAHLVSRFVFVRQSLLV
jgi:hypothetical protein